MKTKPMSSDAVTTVRMALWVMQNPKTSDKDRARCADIIEQTILKADDGLRQAAEILTAIAADDISHKTQKAAAAWLNGGAR